MPPFTSKSKKEKCIDRIERDMRRAGSTPALPTAPPLSTLPPAPPQRHQLRGVNPTLFTSTGRKVIPSAKAIEENGSSAQTHTQFVQPTREFTHRVFEFNPWPMITDDEQVLRDDTEGERLYKELTNMT